MKFLGVPSSGSIAGTTSSHNRAGQYTRNRRMPVQPVGSGRRSFVRAAFGAASSAWATLTGPEQAAWTSFAAGHPVNDSLGQSIILTGQQMYVRVNASLLNVLEAQSTTPPSSVALPDVSPSVLAYSIATGASVSGFTGAGADFAVVAFSRPVSPGIGFMKTFWQPLAGDGFSPADSAPYALPAATYAAEFGVPVLGQKIFARVTPVNEFGWNGTPVVISALVAA